MALRQTIQYNRPQSLNKPRIDFSLLDNRQYESPIKIQAIKGSANQRPRSVQRKRIPIFAISPQKKLFHEADNKAHEIRQNKGRYQRLRQIRYTKKNNVQGGRYRKISGLLTPEELADLIYGIKNSRNLTRNTVNYSVNNIKTESLPQQNRFGFCSCID